ncbi:hypothetical protein H2198_004491 [Neophaeococcomyces mojaviensis]|uniref:Uncharacterized protein n=1 Tax=Neophaeococcomyces mojaviensis TaxID=3383035 RepID=A0ACC3A8C2_9EURO|nr:hypothetical protein H2198_004491 [Knufia sp. JES_112]
MGMVRTLWQKVDASIQLQHKKVFVSVPDFAVTNDSLAQQIRPLLEAAGLQAVRFWPLCKTSLMYLYNLEDCVDEGPACENYRGRPTDSVLSIHLDQWSMSLRSMIREDGMFYPGLGNTKLIWREAGTKLDDEIKKFTNTTVDLVLLSGPEASQLYKIVEQLFKDNANIVPEDYVRSAEDHTFAAARGAARLARDGMCNDFTVCIPNAWCPVSNHCKWAFYGQQSEQKTEL